MQDLRGVVDRNCHQGFVDGPPGAFLTSIYILHQSYCRLLCDPERMKKAPGTHLCRLAGRLFPFCFSVICLHFKLETWLSEENLVLSVKRKKVPTVD